ncbi:hypothetical protein I4U23_021431 [Adineta vaga]|nr:hypothetical protein I4U23_021431 [Adineta vaga]
MKSILFLFVLININNAFLHFNKHSSENTTDHRVLGNVKIYSNLAEIIQPLGKLPLEFSEDDWRDIRSDSVTLVGTNVNITQQTITEKKQSLNNAHIFVRAPSSSNTETKFVKATLIDERRNLVKLIDKDISKDPIFFTASSDHIVYENDPPQSKYYVNFTFDTTDAVYVSYLRSNLNWKTRYQLNLFNESKNAVLISMADIRNDGQSRVDIEHAELLGGDINLQMHSSSNGHHVILCLKKPCIAILLPWMEQVQKLLYQVSVKVKKLLVCMHLPLTNHFQSKEKRIISYQCFVHRLQLNDTLSNL